MRRSRPAFLGSLLAVIAMFCLVAVSGWHSAIVHDHKPVLAANIEHDHERSEQTDSDGLVHMLAHATSQFVALAGPLATPTPAIISDRGWSLSDIFLYGGIDPSELLRPPRG